MKSNDTFKQRILGLQGNLLSFAYQLTTNREQAQDLLQDTTLKALDNESKYVDNVNFKGWIFTIMRNIFINNYRQTVRKATVIDQTEDLYHLNVCQDSGFCESGRLICRKGDKRRIGIILRRLPHTVQHVCGRL